MPPHALHHDHPKPPAKPLDDPPTTTIRTGPKCARLWEGRVAIWGAVGCVGGGTVTRRRIDGYHHEGQRFFFSLTLPPPSPTTGDVIFMAVSVAVVAGWGALSAFDHRRSSMLLPGQDELHIVSVVVFLGGFCTLHAMISHWYYIKSPFSMRFARLRRASYFAVEGVHIVMCVLFSVFAMLSNVFHAILIEYIVATLFCSLNVLSFVILLRVRDHAVSQELDRAWT